MVDPNETFIKSLHLPQEIATSLIVAFIIFIIVNIFRIILKYINKKKIIPKWLLRICFIRQEKISTETNIINKKKRFVESIFNGYTLIISFFCLLMIFSLWHDGYLPLRFQSKTILVHYDEAFTYPKLGLIINLKNPRSVMMVPRLPRFTLVTKNNKIYSVESISSGDYWDFEVDKVKYRLVFICDAMTLGKFKLSYIGKSK